MKVLIVYELVPESTKFYVVNVSDADWEWMRLTHDKFGGTFGLSKADAAACSRLSEFLVGKETKFDGPIAVTGFDYVIHTGWLL